MPFLDIFVKKISNLHPVSRLIRPRMSENWRFYGLYMPERDGYPTPRALSVCFFKNNPLIANNEYTIKHRYPE